MGTTLGNSFDGITPSGTTITTGNSATGSGAAINTVVIGAGATLASSSTHTAHNGLALKCATGGAAAQAYVQWGSTSLPTMATAWWRAYCYFTANPSAPLVIVTFCRSGPTPTSAIQIGTGGKVQFTDNLGATQLTSTASIPLNQWFRLEGFITGSATAGKAEIKCFFTALDSVTADEKHTSPGTLNTGGQVTTIRYGVTTSLASVAAFWLDDIGVSSSGYMGPLWSPVARVGASVFSPVYGSGQTTMNANWDAVLNRDMASGPNGAMRVYYTGGEGDLTSATSEVITQTGNGTKCCISLKPWRDSTSAYNPSTTIPGQSITYGQELANVAATVQAYLDAGVQACQIEICLWHEANYQAENGPFGFGATTVAQAAAHYAAYHAFYAPAICSKGIKLTYMGSMAGPNSVGPFFPGNQQAALAPYFGTIGADYYAWDYVGNSITLANLTATASTWNTKIAVWEWGMQNGKNAPGTTAFVSWAINPATSGGQFLQVFLAWVAGGGQVADLIWFAGSGGDNNITSSSPPSIISAVQQIYDSIAVKSGAVTVNAQFTLTANGQDISGTTKFGAATMRGTFTLTGNGTRHIVPAAQILTLFSLVTTGGQASFIIQQANGVTSFDYGASSIEMTTTAGNTLVVLAGWDLSTTPVTAPMPAVNISDSAGNYWVHAGTSPSGITATRCAAWVCVNAQAIEWLSVSLTTFASSMAYTVLEVAGPPLLSLDTTASNGQDSASSLTVSPGAATDDDLAFSVYAIGSLSPAQPALPGWNALTSVAAAGTSLTTTASTTGGGFPPNTRPFVPATVSAPANPVQIYPYFQVAPAGTNLATTFSVGGQSVPYSGVTFAIRTDARPPYQPDAEFPVLKVEIGLGYTPGDPSQPPPAWTDITQRCMTKDGDQFIQITMGRQYELSTPEAGSITVACYNGDGALTPGGPNALAGLSLEAPLRVSAYWQGSWYALGYAWVERYPQEWPDLPQWGMSRMVATDAISVMAAVNMVSAMDAEALLDAPYVMIPAAEQYLSFSNGLNSFGGSGFSALGYYSVADAQGLTAQNVSRLNQAAGMYVDGQGIPPGGTSPAIAQTGATTNLLGTSNTGFGTSSIGTTTAPTAPLSGPGLVYTDPNMPDPLSQNGVTVSFWVIIPAAVTSTALQPTVFTAYGPPTCYPAAHGSLSVQVQNFTSSNTIKVTLADGSTVTAPFNVSSSPQRITLCLTSSSLSVYVNGALGAITSLTAAQTTTWNAVSLGCPNYAYGSGGTVAGNFTAFGLAIHACQVPVQRIVAQYNTGISGQQNAGAVTRLAQILSWAGIGVARGGRQTFNGASQDTLQGPAYSLSGSTAAAQAAQVALNEGGMLAAQPTGEVEFIHRWALLNQDPVATFGDNPDPAAGEIPYQPAQAWGFDNSYLANAFQVAQQYGANTLFTATGANLPSEQQYFPRAGPQQTIQTMSALDATGLVNWSLGKYSQPGLRVAALTVDAAANPAAAFPAVLSLRQGQVATVIRRPVGAPVIQQNCIVQKIQHAIGGKTWQASYQLSPYDLESAVLQLDQPGSDVVGNNALA